MAGNISLNIVTDGLVLYLDAANTKSLADVPATNLFKNSQQFENWNKYQSTVSANTTTAPDGTTTADTNIETSGLTGFRGVSQQFEGMTGGQTYTFSIYAKYNGRNIQMTVYDIPNYANYYIANFNLQLGTISNSYATGNAVRINSSIVSVGNGWYRCSISGYIPGVTQLQPYVMLLNSSNTTTYTGDGVSGVHLWGGQFETGPTATTYIPTTSTIASRVPPWSDVSRRGNTGTLINGVAYDSQNGGSLVFDGIDDKVTVPYINSYNLTSLTVLVWIKPTSPYTGVYRCVISKQSSSGNIDRDWNFYLYSSASNGVINNLHFSTARATGYNGVCPIPGGSLSLDVWHQCGFTLSSGGLNYILDGVIIFSTPVYNFSGANSSYSISIGSADNYTKGNISISQVYNRVLSSSEVLQNYNTTKSRYI